jgi:tetratricopeptide (TPR) repeat protein
MRVDWIATLATVTALSLSVPTGAHESGDDEGAPPSTVHFATTCRPEAQPAFDRGLTALHNFYFGEAKRSFQSTLETDADCAIAYWGLATNSLGNLLVNPPTPKSIAEANELLQKAYATGTGSQRERDYLDALNLLLLADTDKTDYRAHTLAYERAMRTLYERYPQDSEAAVFYALALNITALHNDKTYANQLKAASILDRVLAHQPDHPGALHYLIHSLDYPPLAERALSAANRYAQVAPASPHALHMPSHTYSMLGKWDESIKSNTVALVTVQKSFEKGITSQIALNGSTAHYNDFMIYAYLQLSQDEAAKGIVQHLTDYQIAHDLSKDPIYTQTGFAAPPARYVMERRAWTEAKGLEVKLTAWTYAEAMTRFVRSLGASRTGDLVSAQLEIDKLTALREAAVAGKQGYWEGQVEVLRLAASAWLTQARGQNTEAIRLMRSAADLEDASEKHIAMENRLYPMRELLADLLLESGQPAKALVEYEASMSASPNRFNAFAGAAKAAAVSNNPIKASDYYVKLLALGANADTIRPDLLEARRFATAH